jgi:hypothetical protein
MPDTTNFIKKLSRAMLILENKRRVKRTDFVNSFCKHLPLRYRIGATPLRVPNFQHNFNISQKNIDMLTELEKHERLLLHTSKEGELRFYPQAIVLIDKANEKYPISFFYGFQPTEIDGKEAIQNLYMWRSPLVKDFKIDGLSLRSYCAFNILLPNVGIIISAEEHTEAGERAAKSQLKEAISKNLFIYYEDETGNLKEISKADEIDKLDIWGDTSQHRKRLTVISTTELHHD